MKKYLSGFMALAIGTGLAGCGDVSLSTDPSLEFAEISITPDAALVVVGDEVLFFAELPIAECDAGDCGLDRRPLIEWSSSDRNIAQIVRVESERDAGKSFAVIKALGQGSARITAQAGLARNSATVEVPGF